MAKVETGTEARQANKGKPVLYVLLVALVLAIAAGGGLLIWQGAESPKDSSSRSQDAARETATDPSKPANAEPPSNPKDPQPAAPTAR